MVKGAALLTISTIAFAIAGYITNIWLGRTLGPEMYGLYGLVISVWTFVNLILISGVPSALTKHISASEKETDSIFASVFKIHIYTVTIVTILYFLVAPMLAIIFKDQRLVLYFRLSALIVPFYSLHSLYVSYYNGLRNFVKQAFVSTVYPISKIIFVIGFAKMFGLAGAIVGFVAAPLFTLIFSFKRPKSNVPKFPFRKIISFSLPAIGFIFFFILIQSIDLYSIKILLLKSESVGYYTAVQNVSSLPLHVMGSLVVVLFPSISKLNKKNNNKNSQKSSRVISTVLRFSILTLLPFSFLISATSTSLVKLIYSSAYEPAGGALSILIFAYSLLTIYSVFANSLNGAGRPNESMFVGLVSLVSSIIFCYLLIPKYGISGAAAATTISALIAVVISGFLVVKRFGISLPLKSFFNILFAALVVYLISSCLEVTGLAIIVLYFAMAIIYLGILFLLKEFTQDDLDLVKLVLPKWKIN